MLFEPLNSDGQKRSALYHAARLSMLHDRLMRKLKQVDDAACEVEQTAAILVDATHQPTATAGAQGAISRSRPATLHLEPGQTLGF